MNGPSLPLDALRITELLYRAGALSTGEVSDVDIAESQSNLLSQTYRLNLSYAGEARGAPASLFLKTSASSRPDSVRTEGPNEVKFYSQIAASKRMSVLPNCYDAHWNAETGAWYLVLEDLSGSHQIASKWPIAPSMDRCKGMVRALARFHAGWWADPQLGSLFGVCPSEATAPASVVEPLRTHLVGGAGSSMH